MVTASGPPLTTCTTISPALGSVTRSIVSSSTGGNAARKTPSGPTLRKAKTRSARRTSGARPRRRRCLEALGALDAPTPDPVGVGRAPPAPLAPLAPSAVSTCSRTDWLLHTENSAPAQLRELALVRVEHELAGELVRELDDRTLSLPHGDDVRQLRARQARSGAIQPEHVAVDVKRV